jgi:murein DD-endopeptidase MepM/ murein hydrolase activator NlpD
MGGNDGIVSIPRQIRVILIADERASREFGFSRLQVLFFGGLALLVVGFLALLLISYAARIGKERDFQSLRDELTAANAQLENLDELSAELERMRAFQERVLRILGVEEVAAAREDSLIPWSNSTSRNAAEALRRAASAVAGPAPKMWPSTGYVTREFDPGDPRRGILPHLGIDIAGPTGAPLVAAAEGQVYRTGSDEYLGKFVEIQHGLGYVTVYGHCSRIAVQKGDDVAQGQVIAYVGQSGQASAPHLHFEIWREGEAIDPRDLMTGDPPRQ